MGFNQYIKGKILSLSSCSTTINISELVSFLQNEQSIADLSLNGDNTGDQSIIELTKLKNLASLTLSQMYISGERAKELTQFADSTSLALVKNNISNEGAKVLAKLKNIKALISNNVSYEGEKELNKLKNIDVYVDNIASAENVQELAKPASVNFNKYVRGNILSIQFCSTINISELVSFLQSNPNITSLNLADCNISDEDAKELARLKSLTSLTLAGNKISNEGAKALANGSFINLTHLDLSDNRIGDEGVKELAKLTNLTYLDLSENIISDKGAKELVRLKKLTYLALLENDISDKVVEELLDKLINLTSFDLLDNDASYESEERQLVECATQTNEVDDLTSVASDFYSKGIKNLEGEPATVSDSKTSSNTGYTGKLNSNHVSMPVSKREQDSNKQLNDLNGNALHSVQKSRLPIITVSILTIAGVVLGIATAVYLEMQAAGIAVGTCCLVAAGIVYYCNKPARLLKDNNVQEFSQDVQELVR